MILIFYYTTFSPLMSYSIQNIHFFYFNLPQKLFCGPQTSFGLSDHGFWGIILIVIVHLSLGFGAFFGEIDYENLLRSRNTRSVTPQNHDQRGQKRFGGNQKSFGAHQIEKN